MFHANVDVSCPMTDPWDWYIYTYMNGCFLRQNMVNVGKYPIHGLYGCWLRLFLADP